MLTERIVLSAVVEAGAAAAQLRALLEGSGRIAVRDEEPALHDSRDVRSRSGEARPGEVPVRMRMVERSNVRLAAELGAEGYRLDVHTGGVTVVSASPEGFLHAVSTLRQLLPASFERPLRGPRDEAGKQARAQTEERVATLPCLEITDRPRFSWRGFHFDVARHFFPLSVIREIIDLLSLYKMNRFHWHLTDDQGWRIEIKSHPELTAVGGFRTEESGAREGGFYTQEVIREVIDYAAARGITVVPEIEMPGHAGAALAAHPDLSCRRQPLAVSSKGGISKEVFCAGREETFNLLEEVLGEVCELFPSTHIHVGGDECPKDRWRECPDCRRRMQENGLADEDELQSYFIRRIGEYLRLRGKRLVGWDEILEGGLAPDSTVMSWRGVDGGVAAARSGHDVVMCPTSHCYFDYRQSANPGEPGPTHFHPPVTTLEKVYGFEPIPPSLEPEEAARILGGQANLWTEEVATAERAEYMLMPRLCALAEALWSPADARDWESFKRRLKRHAARLDRLGIVYCHTLESM